jgi:hypothetical protein
VDVLLIAGEIGEGIHIDLQRFDPIADSEHCADPILQSGKAFEDKRLPRITRCGFGSH